jgi:hypothetical protein
VQVPARLSVVFARAHTSPPNVLTKTLSLVSTTLVRAPLLTSLSIPDSRRLSEAPPPEGDDETPAAGPGGAAPTTGGRYVPPSLRNRGPGERMPGAPGGGPGGSRDDLPTLRVTNISEDVEENDLRDLFGTFGRVARVYVGRDRETGAGKGFAFVSFEDREIAKRAMEKLHGRGYDNLILSVQWSRTSVLPSCGRNTDSFLQSLACSLFLCTLTYPDAC